MSRFIAVFVIAGAVAVATAACRVPSASQPVCPVVEAPPPPLPITVPCDDVHHDNRGGVKLKLAKAKFSDLPGWQNDQHSQAVPALIASCEQLAKLPDSATVGSGPYGGRVWQWWRACTRAKRLAPGDDAAARKFFEKEFVPYAAYGTKGRVGKMTGYYVQELRGSKTRGGKYQFPLYARPPDLLSIQLSSFFSDGRSRRIWGRVDPKTQRFVRYWTRAEIRKKGKAEVLLWVDDPVDSFAIEIEGSGKAKLPDGTEMWINFAAKNGRGGRGIGEIMRAIRQVKKYYAARPDTPANRKALLKRYFQIIDLKRSLVLFQVEPRGGAIGTQDVVLTPGRSLAVDRSVISLSTPIWVDTTAPTAPGKRHGPWQHLVIAQDTGGSIKGPVRGDIYFGDDRDAAAIGGRTNNRGQMWLLLPRGIRVPTIRPKTPKKRRRAVPPPPNQSPAGAGEVSTQPSPAGTVRPSQAKN